MATDRYYKSRHWTDIKSAFRIAVNTASCEACGDTLHPGFPVHHKTYATQGAERWIDLLVLDEKCHRALHSYHRTHYPRTSNYAGLGKNESLTRASDEFVGALRMKRGLLPHPPRPVTSTTIPIAETVSELKNREQLGLCVSWARTRKRLCRNAALLHSSYCVHHSTAEKRTKLAEKTDPARKEKSERRKEIRRSKKRRSKRVSRSQPIRAVA